MLICKKYFLLAKDKKMLLSSLTTKLSICHYSLKKGSAVTGKKSFTGAKYISECSNRFTIYQSKSTLSFSCPKNKAFENILGKGENAGYQHFLLFPKCFQNFLKRIF